MSKKLTLLKMNTKTLRTLIIKLGVLKESNYTTRLVIFLPPSLFFCSLRVMDHIKADETRLVVPITLNHTKNSLRTSVLKLSHNYWLIN